MCEPDRVARPKSFIGSFRFCAYIAIFISLWASFGAKHILPRHITSVLQGEWGLPVAMLLVTESAFTHGILLFQVLLLFFLAVVMKQEPETLRETPEGRNGLPFPKYVYLKVAL